MMVANLEDNYQSVEHEYVIHALKSDRNDIEHGSAGSNNRPDVIGLAILSWYALGEILTNWRTGKHKYTLNRFNQMKSDDCSYGYITKLESNDTMISPFSRGVNGDNIKFKLSDISFCPEIGDPVKFELKSEGGIDIATEVCRIPE